MASLSCPWLSVSFYVRQHRRTDMAYEDIQQSGAFICKHIDYPRRPILRVTRDHPVADEDSGWQFLCGASSHDASDAAIWRLEEVVALDPTVRSLLDSEPCHSFERTSSGGVWVESQYINA